MRALSRLTGCSLLLVSLVFTLSCRTERRSLTSTDSPRLVFDKVCHDFGTVGRGAVKSCRFTFRNQGGAPLLVEAVKPSCGCAVARLPEKVYGPGESGTIEVTYAAQIIRSQSPAERHRLVVCSNDPQNRVTTLTIQANLVDVIRVDPPELEITYINGRDDATPVSLSSLDGRPFSILGHKSSKEVLNFVYDPNESGPRHVLRPLLNQDKMKKIGTLRGRAYLASSHPDCATIVIPFTLKTDHE